MPRRISASWRPYAGQGIPIVVGGTSCGLELKSDYRELLGIHTAEAKLVAEHVYDINEFLWLQHEAGRLKTDFQPQSGRYMPYHTSCHQKLHRIGRPALDLLGLVPGLIVEEMGVDCCGITGTYGYKHEKYDIAQAVGKPLFEKHRRPPARRWRSATTRRAAGTSRPAQAWMWCTRWRCWRRRMGWPGMRELSRSLSCLCLYVHIDDPSTRGV